MTKFNFWTENLDMETSISTEISDLPDDCLLQIFSFLQTKDLLRIEAVCKRWQHVSLRTKKEISIQIRQNNILKKILEKHGHTIVELNLDIHRYYDDIFEIIDKYCSKLLKKLKLKLVVNKFPIDHINVKKFTFFKNLETFHFCDYDHAYDSGIFWKVMRNLLDDTDKLKDLKLNVFKKCFAMKNKSLLICNFNMNENYLNKCLLICNINMNELFTEQFTLEQMFQRFLKLNKHEEGEELMCRVSTVTYFYLELLQPIANQLTCLKLIKIGDDCFEGIGYQSLHFENLNEVMLFDVSGLTDIKFSSFIKKCPKLRKVSITAKNTTNTRFFESRRPSIRGALMTDEGFRSLGYLKELTHLTINFKGITGSTFEFIAMNCSQLEVICCSVIEKLLVFQLINIVSLLPKLNSLKLPKFQLWTTKTLASLSKIVKERKNNVKLEIKYCDVVFVDETEKLMLIEKNQYSDRTKFFLTIDVWTQSRSKQHWERKVFYVKPID